MRVKRYLAWLSGVAVAVLLAGTVAAAQQPAGDDAPAAANPETEDDAQTAATDGDAAAEADAEETQADVPTPDAVAATVLHTPVHELSGEALDLVFDVLNPQLLGDLVVRTRPLEGDGDVQEVVATGGPGQYVARLDTAEVTWPGFAYWVVERGPNGAERPIFASESDPQPVHVLEAEGTAYERRRLSAWGGRRSRLGFRGEYVNLGARQVLDGAGMPVQRLEYYYNVGVTYAYSFFSIVDTIQIGLGRMRGNAAERMDDQRGVDYGHGEITWHAHDLLRFETGLLFGFSQSGFEIGGKTDIIIGEPDGNSLTLGISGVTNLGVTGKIRLAWATVPRWPMGATVEVTTYPVGDRSGMRLLYDISYQLYPGAFVRLEGGYRGWGSTVGGPSLGGELALSF